VLFWCCSVVLVLFWCCSGVVLVLFWCSMARVKVKCCRPSAYPVVAVRGRGSPMGRYRDYIGTI
jgi:hypothetical protein